jgi:hypothetical protein
MSDIKLFRIGADTVKEEQSQSATVEKSLQTLIERHLEAFLSVRFLDTEYSTGKTHGGRIDTLGIDEDEPHHLRRDGPAVLLTDARQSSCAPSHVPRRVQLRQAAQEPSRPHALRANLSALDRTT